MRYELHPIFEWLAHHLYIRSASLMNTPLDGIQTSICEQKHGLHEQRSFSQWDITTMSHKLA